MKQYLSMRNYKIYFKRKKEYNYLEVTNKTFSIFHFAFCKYQINFIISMKTAKNKYQLPEITDQLSRIPQNGHTLEHSQQRFDNILLGEKSKGRKKNYTTKKQQNSLYLKIKSVIKNQRSKSIDSIKSNEANKTIYLGTLHKSNPIKHKHKQMKDKFRDKIDEEQERKQYVFVQSKQQKQLMNYLSPRLPVVLEKKAFPKNKSRGKIDSGLQFYANPEEEQRRQNQNLEQILSNKDKFMKTYFSKLSFYKRRMPEAPVSFNFPDLKVGPWIVSGYIIGDHVFLKGKKKNRNDLIKKYSYEKVYQRVRKDYRQWVIDKFCFQT